ncbi:hypothetical protein N9L02_00930 [Gammaproteobacteria bacterium]|nr:hypothetical protein [Gammaproteobacteria bacterium]
MAIKVMNEFLMVAEACYINNDNFNYKIIEAVFNNTPVNRLIDHKYKQIIKNKLKSIKAKHNKITQPDVIVMKKLIVSQKLNEVTEETNVNTAKFLKEAYIEYKNWKKLNLKKQTYNYKPIQKDELKEISIKSLKNSYKEYVNNSV